MTYTAAQWGPIAKVLGRWSADHKAAIEAIGRRYQSMPTAAQLRQLEKRQEAAPGEVWTAVNDLLVTLEGHGWDYRVGGKSLRKALDEIGAELEQEVEFAGDNPPQRSTEKHPTRNWYLDQLVGYWFGPLGRRDGVTVDRVTAKTRERPVVTYLRAATAPLLGGHPLTAEMCKHAIDRYRRAQKAKAEAERRRHRKSGWELGEFLDPLEPVKPVKRKRKRASAPRMAKRAA